MFYCYSSSYVYALNNPQVLDGESHPADDRRIIP